MKSNINVMVMCNMCMAERRRRRRNTWKKIILIIMYMKILQLHVMCI